MLALSFDEFRSRFGTIQLEGLIPPDSEPVETEPATGDAATAPLTVITDTRDTAAMIVANAARAELPPCTSSWRPMARCRRAADRPS